LGISQQEQDDFEDIHVLTYQRLKNMAVLVQAALYFAAVWTGTRTKPMEIVAGENACFTLLAFICLKMELHWKSNPIGKVCKNLPFFQKLADKNYT